MRKRPPVTEEHVHDLTKAWYERHFGWRYSPVQTGMGEHGIHDNVGGIPVIVTQAMVGKIVNLAVTVEDKRPGRRKEKDRGMSKNQVIFMNKVIEAGGISICCDGAEDLELLDRRIHDLTTVPHDGTKS